MSRPCPLYGKAIYADCMECETKVCKKEKYNKIVVGIDQSYKNTGISIFADGEKKIMRGIKLEKYASNSEKRAVLSDTLDKLFTSIHGRANETICVMERIRLQSSGFLNIDYIKSIGALNAIIIDTSKLYDVTTYSVDTRCWKSQAIGTSKPLANNFGVDPKKWPTVKWCIDNGWEEHIIHEITNKQKKKGVFEKDGKRWSYDDDVADSAGICTFGFIGAKDKLKEEK